MGFISSLGQVVSNRKQFREWEKQDKDKKEQKKALENKNAPTEAEIKKAASEGEVIMNIVDTMDTYSEEVAENVETTIMPVAQLAPLGLTTASALLNVKFNITPAADAYDKAVSAFHASDDGKKLSEVAKKLKQFKDANPDKLKNMGFWEYTPERLFSKKNLKILSESTDDTVKGLYGEILELSKKYKNIPEIKNLSKRIGAAGGITAAIAAVSFVAANLIAAKLQVRSSRIARWQSRADLNDPKYFVQYTDEQKENAKARLEQQANENKNKKSFLSAFGKNDPTGKRTNLFSSLKGVLKDNKNYSEWNKTYNPEDKKITRPLSAAELEEAQKDKDVIQSITKQINNNAEEYGENMETAAGVLIGGTPFLGAGVGALVNAIINKTGLGEKISDSSFQKMLGKLNKHADKDKLKDLYSKIKESAKTANPSAAEKTAYLKNQAEFIKESMYGLESGRAKEGIAAALEKAQNIFTVAKTTKTARNVMIAAAGSIITGTAGALIGLKLQKSASRVGRYKAKREIESDPANFIGHSDEEYKSVSDIKGEQDSKFKKFLNYITFIPRSVKEYFEYEKYKKTEAKAQKELLNELVKSSDVTEEQIKEAKDLQRKLFTTFENVDDKSQEYSESVEAVTEMATPFLPYLGIGLAVLPFAAAGIKLFKGGAPQGVEKISGFFAKHSKMLKSKFVNNYADEVSENIKSVVKNQNPADMKNFDFLKIFGNKINAGELGAELKDLFNKAKGDDATVKSLLESLSDSKTLKNLSKDDLNKILDNLTSENFLNKLPKELNLSRDKIDELKKFAADFMSDSDDVSSLLKKVLNTFDIPDIRIKDLSSGINFNSDEFAAFADFFKKFGGNMKESNISGITKAALEGQIKNGNWRKALEEIANNTSGTPKQLITKLLNSSLTDEQAVNIFNNFAEISKNIPAKQLKKIIGTALEEFKNNPEKFTAALQNGEFKQVLLTKGLVKAGSLTAGGWSALMLLLTFAVQSSFASAQKKAGRLGVMNALEELKDPAYYANAESANNTPFAFSTGFSGFNLNGNLNMSDFINQVKNV